MAPQVPDVPAVPVVLAPAVNPPATPSSNFLVTLGSFLKTAFPQRAKYFAADMALLVAYLQAYGPVWKLVPAITAIATGLGVYGIPNAAKPSI
jgi:hypothetical protein